MSETHALSSLVNRDQILPLSLSDYRQQPETRSILSIRTPHSPLEYSYPVFNSKKEDLIGWQLILAFNANRTSWEFYRQHWEADVYNRFQETRKRFPEFFPCFELKYDLIKGLQYSIYFKPLTKHAEALMYNAPLFPIQEKFKPIKQLWNEDGQSELDLIFKSFPTQLALNPPKEPWGARWWKLVLGLAI